VCQRQLADRLADHGEEGTRALELERDGLRLEARAQRVRGAYAEGCKRGESKLVRLAVGRKEELQRPDRRLAELECRRQR